MFTAMPTSTPPSLHTYLNWGVSMCATQCLETKPTVMCTHMQQFLSPVTSCILGTILAKTLRDNQGE